MRQASIAIAIREEPTDLPDGPQARTARLLSVGADGEGYTSLVYQ